MGVLRYGWAWLERFSSSPRNLLLVDIVLGVAVAGLAATFLFYSAQTHGALCTFRGDLQQRVDSSRHYLATHQGDLKFGDVRIPREQIVAQVASQQATLRSLDNLNC